MPLNLDNMNSMYIDVLKEISNIGAGNAATSLSNMVMKKVDMEVPKIDVLEIEKLVEALGYEENIVVGIYISFMGDINGTILTVLDKSSADNLMKIFFGQKSEGELYNEMEQSALQEIGNILSGAYINSISSMTNMTINISVPSVTVDMVGSILSVPAVEYGQMSDKIIFIENKLDVDDDRIIGDFLLMPVVDSFEILFKRLGVL